MFSVLIVEDDINLNKLMNSFLTQNGYKVTTAFNGRQGLEKFNSNYTDIIISDIMMPDINGYEFVSYIREENNSVPILFVSAKDAFESKQKGFDVGIDDYMVKPIDLNELLLRIKALLRRAKIVNEKRTAKENAEKALTEATKAKEEAEKKLTEATKAKDEAKENLTKFEQELAEKYPQIKNLQEKWHNAQKARIDKKATLVATAQEELKTAQAKVAEIEKELAVRKDKEELKEFNMGASYSQEIIDMMTTNIVF